MKAYVVVYEDVKDEETFAIYKSKVIPSFEKFGGKFVTRGANLQVVEGTPPHPRLVIIEFPSSTAANDWYNSPDYQAIIPYRLKSTVGNFVIVDGME